MSERDRDHPLADVARDHLGAGRPLHTRVSGHSMWPWLGDGDAVVIVPLVGAPRVGDIVLVETRTRLVLHRVVAIAGDAVTIKGDAEPTVDGQVARRQILGRLDQPAWLARVAPIIAALSLATGPLGARVTRLARSLWKRLDPR